MKDATVGRAEQIAEENETREEYVSEIEETTASSGTSTESPSLRPWMKLPHPNVGFEIDQ